MSALLRCMRPGCGHEAGGVIAVEFYPQRLIEKQRSEQGHSVGPCTTVVLGYVVCIEHFPEWKLGPENEVWLINMGALIAHKTGIVPDLDRCRIVLLPETHAAVSQFRDMQRQHRAGTAVNPLGKPEAAHVVVH